MSTAVVHSPEGPALVAPARTSLHLLRPIVKPAELMEVQNETRDLVRQALKEGRDYGIIPGTDRKTLLKPGAERVANAFGCQYGELIIVDKEIDHDREVKWRKYKKGGASYEGISFGLYRYVVKVPVVELSSSRTVGWGAAAASTMESKYIDRPRDCENTVLKMAAKRARVDGCLTTFGLSDEFSQDMEDGDDLSDDEEELVAPEITLEQALELPFFWPEHKKYGGAPLKNVSTHMLVTARDFAREQNEKHGVTVARLAIIKAAELVIASRQATTEGEQRAGESSGASSASKPPGNGASSTSNAARGPDSPMSQPATTAAGTSPTATVPNDDFDDAIARAATHAASDPNDEPTPAKGAPDSLYVLAKRFRELIEHPQFPQQFREAASLDMRDAQKKPGYAAWLIDRVKVAEDILAGVLDEKQLRALNIDTAPLFPPKKGGKEK